MGNCICISAEEAEALAAARAAAAAAKADADAKWNALITAMDALWVEHVCFANKLDDVSSEISSIYWSLYYCVITDRYEDVTIKLDEESAGNEKARLQRELNELQLELVKYKALCEKCETLDTTIRGLETEAEKVSAENIGALTTLTQEITGTLDGLTGLCTRAATAAKEASELRTQFDTANHEARCDRFWLMKPVCDTMRAARIEAYNAARARAEELAKKKSEETGENWEISWWFSSDNDPRGRYVSSEESMLTTSTGLGPELELFGCGVTSFEIPKDEDLIYCPRPAAPEEEKTGRWVSNREYYGKRPHGMHRHEYRTGDRYVKN